jgi:putative DeoR family transcriptional regulator (stage III sporulation protein D)
MRNLSFVREVVEYFNQNKSTVRKTADAFGISKSTVYVYLTEVMPNEESFSILEKNKQERNIRGGLATKEKYSRGFKIRT